MLPVSLMVAAKTEDYQLFGEVLNRGGRRYLGVVRERQAACLEPLLQERAKYPIQTLLAAPRDRLWVSKIAESPAQGGRGMLVNGTMLSGQGCYSKNKFQRAVLEKFSLTIVQLPHTDIFVSLCEKSPIGKPGRGIVLSVVEGTVAPIHWEELDRHLSKNCKKRTRATLWMS